MHASMDLSVSCFSRTFAKQERFKGILHCPHDAALLSTIRRKKNHALVFMSRTNNLKIILYFVSFFSIIVSGLSVYLGVLWEEVESVPVPRFCAHDFCGETDSSVHHGDSGFFCPFLRVIWTKVSRVSK